MIYNTIHHEIRNNAGLSLIDWCLLESIYKLSTSPKAMYKNWCNAPKNFFSYLASTRTIATRYSHLEKVGFLEFKDDKRLLKRTTKKYYEEVYAYILGVKKLHLNKNKGEEVSPLGVKKFHPNSEETSPNNKKDNNINNYTNNSVYKETHTQIEIEKLISENESLKTELKKEKKKSSAKKRKGNHVFPDLKSEKEYNPNDKRKDKNLPFDLVSARQTIDSLFPNWEKLKESFESFSSYKPSKEIYEKCLKTFVEDGITRYYTGIRTIEKLEAKLYEWIQKEVKFQRNEPKKETTDLIHVHNEETEDEYFRRKNSWLFD